MVKQKKSVEQVKVWCKQAFCFHSKEKMSFGFSLRLGCLKAQQPKRKEKQRPLQTHFVYDVCLKNFLNKIISASKWGTPQNCNFF
jgi:hypothetical protein